MNPTFNVTYDKNGAESGDIPVDDNRYEAGDTVIVASNSGTLASAEKTFTGWNSKAEGDSGTSYTPGATFVIKSANVNLFTRWTANPTYTITYMGGDSTSGSPPVPVANEPGVSITIANPGKLGKKGFSFIGWNSEKMGGGDTFRVNMTYIMKA